MGYAKLNRLMPKARVPPKGRAERVLIKMRHIDERHGHQMAFIWPNGSRTLVVQVNN
jgi:hypothetical protein